MKMRIPLGRGVGQLQKGRKWSQVAHDKDGRSRSMEQSSVVGRLSCWGSVLIDYIISVDIGIEHSDPTEKVESSSPTLIYRWSGY